MNKRNRWNKEDISINDVETAIDGLILSLTQPPLQQTVAESHFNSTVMAYVRNQAHKKFPQNDRARAIENSSALAQQTIFYLYVKSKLPASIQEIKDNPGEESKLAFIKLFNKMLNWKLKTIPIDWMRSKKNSSEKVPFSEDIHAKGDDNVENARESTSRLELLYAIDRVISEFDPSDEQIVRCHLLEGLNYEEISVKVGMKYDATRKRCTKGMERLGSELNKMGFKL